MKLKCHIFLLSVKISAIFSACIVLFFCIMLPVLLFVIPFFSSQNIIDKKTGIDTLIFFLLYFGIIIYICGRILALLILSFFPPHISGQRRTKLINAIIIFDFVWISLTVFSACMNFYLKNFVFITILNCIWLYGLSYITLKRHVYPRYFLERPFDLFLRRFSTFADRIVNEAVIKNSSFRMPTAFLTTTKSRAEDWSPSQFVRGLINMPVVLKCNNEQWANAAKELIAKARLIIIDLSERSESMDLEINMLNEMKKWDQTIILINSKNNNLIIKDKNIYTNGSEIISYHNSWNNALTRIVTGFLVSTFTLLIIYSFIMILIIKIISTLENANYQAIAEKIINTDYTMPLFWLIIVVSELYFFLVFFCKPNLDSKSLNLLRKAIEKF